MAISLFEHNETAYYAALSKMKSKKGGNRSPYRHG